MVLENENADRLKSEESQENETIDGSQLNAAVEAHACKTYASVTAGNDNGAARAYWTALRDMSKGTNTTTDGRTNSHARNVQQSLSSTNARALTPKLRLSQHRRVASALNLVCSANMDPKKHVPAWLKDEEDVPDGIPKHVFLPEIIAEFEHYLKTRHRGLGAAIRPGQIRDPSGFYVPRQTHRIEINLESNKWKDQLVSAVAMFGLPVSVKATLNKLFPDLAAVRILRQLDDLVEHGFLPPLKAEYRARYASAMYFEACRSILYGTHSPRVERELDKFSILRAFRSDALDKPLETLITLVQTLEVRMGRAIIIKEASSILPVWLFKGLCWDLDTDLEIGRDDIPTPADIGPDVVFGSDWGSYCRKFRKLIMRRLAKGSLSPEQEDMCRKALVLNDYDHSLFPKSWPDSLLERYPGFDLGELLKLLDVHLVAPNVTFGSLISDYVEFEKRYIVPRDFCKVFRNVVRESEPPRFCTAILLEYVF